MPKISVLMPVYNTEEKYLKESIESILNQTFTDFEFIIINDGSKNNTEQIILSYKDDRVKYIKNDKNLGIIETLNKGLSIANGEYIARMDSDDIALPERLEKQFNYMDKNINIGILGTWFKRIPHNQIIQHPLDNDEIKFFLLYNFNVLGHPTIMIRTSIIQKYNLKYEEQNKHVEDYGLWLAMLNKTDFANIGEILVHYRWHSNNISKQHSEVQIKNANRLKIEAQKDILKINTENILESLNKLSLRKKLNSSDFIILIDYFSSLLEKAPYYQCKKHYIKTIIKLYRFMLMYTNIDVKFLNNLYKNKLNKLLFKFYFSKNLNLGE